MLHKLIVTLAWSCLAFVMYATLSSIDARPVIAGGFFTALERFGAYAVLGSLFYFAYPRRLAFVCFMVLGSAVLLEVLQNLVPGRDARLPAGILQSHFWRRSVSAISQPRGN